MLSTDTLQLECFTEGLSPAQLNQQIEYEQDYEQLMTILLNGGTSVPHSSGNNGAQTGISVARNLMKTGSFQSKYKRIAPANAPGKENTKTTAKKGGKTPSTPNTSNNVATRGNKRKKTFDYAERASSPEIELLNDNNSTQKAPVIPSVVTTLPNAVSRGGGSSLPVNPVSPALIKATSMGLLNISVRPKSFLSPAAALAQRKELDLTVKNALMKSPQDFVEWLLSEGIIRVQQYCVVHTNSKYPQKLKLGIFSDPKVLSTSGGYVWISECCDKKYVSVYSGSIFGSTPIDRVSPQAVLKLIYHWSCQTSIQNVESWVKVEKVFIAKVYNFLRCVCTVIVQDKMYDFGYDSTTVELGIVSLGTSSLDGSKKSVKVEILGLYDRKMSSFRLFASCPEPGSTSHQRFVRVLRPLIGSVHKNATILCDSSIDKNVLQQFGYSRIMTCESSEDEQNKTTNGTIMFYLRKHVPKLFQNSLSQLSLEQVQLVLDELSWRERYATSANECYNNILQQIVYLTSRETENPGLLHLLDYVALNPQLKWKYRTAYVSRTPAAIQPFVIYNSSIARNLARPNPIQITHRIESFNPRSGSTPASSSKSSKSSSNVSNSSKSKQKTVDISNAPAPVMTKIDQYFYGIIEGQPDLGTEMNTVLINCHICEAEFKQNIQFYTHLKWHLYGSIEKTVMCPYCSNSFVTEEELKAHLIEHFPEENQHMYCKICNEHFDTNSALVNHMTRRHYEAEIPYRCEVCQFASSVYTDVIDHFNQKHADTPYVMCHMCLTVKVINSMNQVSFSQRMYQHVQKHSVKNKCKSCLLTFYNKVNFQDHRNKDHISCARYSNLKKIESHPKCIMFLPAAKVSPASIIEGLSDQNYLKASIAMSTMIAPFDNLKVNIEDDSAKCVECDLPFKDGNHFKSYQKCTKCCYSTTCAAMIPQHNYLFHPQHKKGTLDYVIGPPITLPNPLFCICGFSTKSGNNLARHLSVCGGGRKSAYPTYANALGITENPSLDEYLAATRARHKSGSPSLQDLTPFMSMKMEVQDQPIDTNKEVEDKTMEVD